MRDNILMEDKQIEATDSVIERNMIVNGVAIHIKSIFNGKISLQNALGNIAIRKLSNKKN